MAVGDGVGDSVGSGEDAVDMIGMGVGAVLASGAEAGMSEHEDRKTINRKQSKNFIRAFLIATSRFIHSPKLLLGMLCSLCRSLSSDALRTKLL